MKTSFDITTLREGYLSGAFTVSDTIREALQRINAGDPKIWICIDTEESLLEQAADLDSRSPVDLPLYGIPFAVKDNIDVANLPTTAACPDYRYFAAKDAFVIAKLRAAGAIPIGKTNLDQFATGLVGVRSPYGVPGNAFNSEYIPGGSSSGSSVSVALGQVSFSLGTDTAGSGRVPACFNNLVGVKPTRGLLSSSGMLPACKSLDTISIFALNCSDAQLVFRAAKGFDQSDPYSRKEDCLPIPNSRVFHNGAIFGVPSPEQLEFFGDADYREGYLSAVKKLEELGFKKTVIDFSPFLTAARLLYEGPWVAERYWAIQDILNKSPDSLHPTTKTIIEKGIDSTAVDAFDAAYKLQALQQQSLPTWKEVDFLATPTAPTHYTIEELEKDPIQLNSNLGYYTNYMNLLDLSCVAVPTSFTSKDLPFGISLVAPAFHDETLLRVADALQQASGLPLGKSDTKRHAPMQPIEFDSIPIVVCGAHMDGLPLNHQLTDLGATFSKRTQTAAAYRLFALPNTSPPKPGMIRDDANGKPIEVEVWNLPKVNWASFIESIPSPLGIASIELEDGNSVKGFFCENWATEGAKEVTELGGWRNYLKSLNNLKPATKL